MNLSKIIVAVGCALPLFAGAQAVKPADQPRTQLEKEQTQDNGQATKYPGPSSTDGTSSSMSKDSASAAKQKAMKSDKAKAGDTPAGSVPTYPAPTTDGRPTSPSTTK